MRAVAAGSRLAGSHLTTAATGCSPSPLRPHATPLHTPRLPGNHRRGGGAGRTSPARAPTARACRTAAPCAPALCFCLTRRYRDYRVGASACWACKSASMGQMKDGRAQAGGRMHGGGAARVRYRKGLQLAEPGRLGLDDWTTHAGVNSARKGEFSPGGSMGPTRQCKAERRRRQAAAGGGLLARAKSGTTGQHAALRYGCFEFCRRLAHRALCVEETLGGTEPAVGCRHLLKSVVACCCCGGVLQAGTCTLLRQERRLE